MRRLICILAILSTITFVSCRQCEHIDPEDVDYIVFYAMPKNVDFCHGKYSIEDLLPNTRDSTITDKEFIRPFIRALNHLVIDEQVHLVDLRSAAVLHTTEERTITFTFGGDRGIFRDGQKMKDNATVFKMIDQKIYAPHPYEYWLPDSVREAYRSIKKEVRSHIENSAD